MWRAMGVLAAVESVAVPLPAGTGDEECSPLLERCAGLLAENEQLRDENGRLRGERDRLKARVKELEGKVEQLRRASKRQAAPFSRGERKQNPGRPGRRPGSEYGQKAHRPAPEQLDEELEALLEDRCQCGGEIRHERTVYQYQEELPEPRPHRRRYAVPIGRCECCGRRHQGRHPFQTSDALGAAGSMLGPRAVALATQLNKELGLSPQKTARTLELVGGISLTGGGVVQAVARQARRLEPTYQALIASVRESRVVAPDETGWRVDGGKAWLWAFAGEEVTVYLIASGRGYEDAKVILGDDFAGVLERDGWAPYRRFQLARHQTCYGHLLRRASEMIADSLAGQARVPHQLRRILLDGLALRDERDEEIIDAAEFGLRVAELERRTDELLRISPTHAPNRRLLVHLRAEREHLFTFLTTTGVQATNWRAEQALRPAVVNRKSWGGNRSWKGAHTQQIAISVIRTARQQQQDPIELMVAAQRQSEPAISELLRLPARASPATLAA
jgi:transposase